MSSKLKTIATTAVFAVGMMIGAQSANATVVATCDIINFTTSKDCISPIAGGPGGNVRAQEMNDYGTDGAFGFDDWKLIASIGSVSDTSNQFSDGSPFSFSITLGDDGKQSGTWALNPLLTWGTGEYAFVLKGSTDNAAYWMDTAFTSGSWNVTDLFNPGENNPDLSNIRLFGTAVLAPIPLPAAGWLMLAGLGGLAAMRRRKKTS